jgi:hypothetical protein
MASMHEMAAEIRGIWDEAEAQDRNLTSKETARVERLLDQVQQKKALSILDGGGPGFMRGDGSGASFGTGMSPGEVFVASEGYKSVQDPSARGRAWTTGEIDTGLGLRHEGHAV